MADHTDIAGTYCFSAPDFGPTTPGWATGVYICPDLLSIDILMNQPWHPRCDKLEEFVLGRLGVPDSPEVIQLEEHLLVCSTCVNTAESALEFARMIREACLRRGAKWGRSSMKEPPHAGPNDLVAGGLSGLKRKLRSSGLQPGDSSKEGSDQCEDLLKRQRHRPVERRDGLLFFVKSVLWVNYKRILLDRIEKPDSRYAQSEKFIRQCRQTTHSGIGRQQLSAQARGFGEHVAAGSLR